MKNNNYVLVDAATSATGASSKVDCLQLFAISLIAVFSDNTAAGTIKFQGSNDPCPYGNIASDFTPTNWVDVPSSSASVSSGATTPLQLSQICYRWIRVYWTKSGGAGTYSVYINAQGN